MFKNVVELKKSILEYNPKDFVSHFIFEPIPFAFRNDLASWIKWKTQLSHLLEVDPYDIVLTGSASIGYSLNPYKDFKTFDAYSDIDCGIISNHHFDLAWRYLRNLQPRWLTLPPASKRAIQAHRENYVFSGTIATDSMLGLLPFGPRWKHALSVMSHTKQTKRRDVKLRIYKDYDALRHYQAYGIEKLRLKLSDQDKNKLNSIKQNDVIGVEE